MRSKLLDLPYEILCSINDLSLMDSALALGMTCHRLWNILLRRNHAISHSSIRGARDLSYNWIRDNFPSDIRVLLVRSASLMNIITHLYASSQSYNRTEIPEEILVPGFDAQISNAIRTPNIIWGTVWPNTNMTISQTMWCVKWVKQNCNLSVNTWSLFGVASATLVSTNSPVLVTSYSVLHSNSIMGGVSGITVSILWSLKQSPSEETEIACEEVTIIDIEWHYEMGISLDVHILGSSSTNTAPETIFSRFPFVLCDLKTVTEPPADDGTVYMKNVKNITLGLEMKLEVAELLLALSPEKADIDKILTLVLDPICKSVKSKQHSWYRVSETIEELITPKGVWMCSKGFGKATLVDPVSTWEKRQKQVVVYLRRYWSFGIRTCLESGLFPAYLTLHLIREFHSSNR